MDRADELDAPRGDDPRSPDRLKVRSIVDALYLQVRERILTGQLPGGTAVTETDLATQYSVARPTAKAAMERLLNDGLLRRGSHKTARVPVLDVADVQDLYYSRGLLERVIMEVLAERRQVPDAARRAVEELRTVSEADVAEVVRIDVAFHQALVDSVGSARLNQLYRSLMGEVRLCMAQVQASHLVSPRRIADEHAAIIAAIEAGEAERVVAEVTAHLDRARRRLVADLEAKRGD